MSCTVKSNNHDHALGRVDPLADLSGARPLGGATQGVDGVDEQIAQHVWHLEAIAQRPRRIRGQIRLQRYARGARRCAPERSPPGEGVHVEPFLPR
jgi:hypothetical protein